MDVSRGALDQQAVGVRGRPSIGRLAASFGLGCIAASSALVFDVPGRGEFIALTWLAGLITVFVAPGIAGFIAVVAGVTIWVALVDALDGTLQLLFLILGIVISLTAQAALVGVVARRMASLGLTASLRDRPVLVGGAIALGLAALFVWFAIKLGGNPP